MIRIVLLSRGFPELVIQLANSLTRYFEVHLFYSKNFLEKENLITCLDKKVILHNYNDYRLRNPMQVLESLRIGFLIRKLAPSLVHIQGNGDAFFGFSYLFFSNIPVINTVHDPRPHSGSDSGSGKLFNISQMISIPISSYYIVHGKKMSNYLSEDFNISPKKIGFTWLGNYNISRNNVNQSKSSSKVRKILFFGRIMEYKGLDLLIEAEKLFRDSVDNYEIVIAGKFSPQMKYLKSLISDNKRIVLRDEEIQTSDISSIFTECSLVVLPYRDATQSGVLSLAYTFGKPVIVTNVGSLPEYVINGKTGFIIEKSSPSSLAKSIEVIFNDEKLLADMSKQSYRYSQNNLSWNSIAKETSRCYLKCLNLQN